MTHSRAENWGDDVSLILDTVFTTDVISALRCASLIMHIDVGEDVGAQEGKKLGIKEGAGLGIADGTEDGFEVGFKDGSHVGTCVGNNDGLKVGFEDGFHEEAAAGKSDGLKDGFEDGFQEGNAVGINMGLKVGFDDGFDVLMEEEKVKGRLMGLKVIGLPGGSEFDLVIGSMPPMLGEVVTEKLASLIDEAVGWQSGLSASTKQGFTTLWNIFFALSLLCSE